MTALALLAVALGAGSVAVATTTEQARGAYVALGDSYVSGPGVPNQRPDAGLCSRSDNNYPSLVARAVNPAAFTDASCSGAVTGDVLESQVGALRPDTALVTLSIGGNDAGFAPNIAICVVLGLLNSGGAPCRAHFTSGGVDRLAQTVDAVGPKVGTVLTAIRQRAPRARVLLVGYPALLPKSKEQCTVDQPIATGDIPYLRAINEQLNRVLADQAAAAGVTFVDTFTSSLGHDACQAAGVRFVEGILGATGAAPVHPNALGMRDMADQVLAAL
ncbi:SGNH/GDSL hydrolase family protein [Actinomycetes bacterium KLBMP 9797]